MWVAWLSGWLMGLSSAGHCFAMCGPLSLSLPFRSSDGKMNWWTYSSYHLGRISTYLLMGAVIAGLGSLISIHTFGSLLSVLSGILLLMMALSQWFGKSVLKNTRIPFPTKWISKVWTSAFKRNSLLGFTLAGAANGFLPCGMVYAAVLAAIGSGIPLMLMLGFGLGTLPVFTILPLLNNQILKHKKLHSVLIPTVLLLTGLWLIYRGVQPFYVHGFGIGPFGLSPACN